MVIGAALGWARGERPGGHDRPDLQFDYKGRRYSVEYDSPTSGRGPAYQSRFTQTTTRKPSSSRIIIPQE